MRGIQQLGSADLRRLTPWARSPADWRLRPSAPSPWISCCTAAIAGRTVRADSLAGSSRPMSSAGTRRRRLPRWGSGSTRGCSVVSCPITAPPWSTISPTGDSGSSTVRRTASWRGPRPCPGALRRSVRCERVGGGIRGASRRRALPADLEVRPPGAGQGPQRAPGRRVDHRDRLPARARWAAIAIMTADPGTNRALLDASNAMARFAKRRRASGASSSDSVGRTQSDLDRAGGSSSIAVLAVLRRRLLQAPRPRRRRTP